MTQTQYGAIIHDVRINKLHGNIDNDRINDFCKELKGNHFENLRFGDLNKIENLVMCGLCLPVRKKT